MVLLSGSLLIACSGGDTSAPAGETPTPGVSGPDNPWAPTTVPFDPTCSSNCVEVGTRTDDHTNAEMMFSLQPDVDDALVQWAQCIESTANCVRDGGAIDACVAQSVCPAPCIAEFQRLAPSEGDAELLGAVFEEVFLNDGSVCLPPTPEEADAVSP